MPKTPPDFAAFAAQKFGPLPALQSGAMETPESAVSLTDGAAAKIKQLVASRDSADESALRVAVRGGGCSGFQYALALDGAKPDDHVFEHSGVAVIVDQVSMQFVFGSEVDFVDGLQGAGFVVNNPNVVAACGCGSSFQVKEDAAEQAAATA
jgi:iron-sulfur cluster assembly protein